MRQTCRPTHHRLVLKCYPKGQKNGADVVDPIPSELSKLLDYTSSRRRKLPKVAAFLEKRTASDIRHGRNRDIQITLQILKALIDKSQQDLPLFANAVLNVLDAVLPLGDLAIAAYSVATFDSFCQQHDGPSLAAAQQYLPRLRDVVGKYINFSRGPIRADKEANGTLLASQWHAIGLQAIWSLSSSGIIGLEGTGQLAAAFAAVLETLRAVDGDCLYNLQRRIQTEGQTVDDKGSGHRLSLVGTPATETAPGHRQEVAPRPVDTHHPSPDSNALIALLSLKVILSGSNRNQIRSAIEMVLDYIKSQLPPTPLQQDDILIGQASGDVQLWAAALLQILLRSVSVQYRYLVLVTAIKVLVECPVADKVSERQLVLATLVQSLLSSDVDLISLSVMDVLNELLRYLLLVLQAGQALLTVQPAALPDTPDAEKAGYSGSSASLPHEISITRQHADSRDVLPNAHRRLLLTLQGCIGDLGRHLYDADQISDMVSALLVKLRQNPGIAAPAKAAEKDSSAEPLQGPVGPDTLPENANSAEFLSSALARAAILQTVMQILHAAAAKAPSERGISSRNQVGADVWEGTHWLLRDPASNIRRLYADVLLFSLRSEVDASSVRALMVGRVRPHTAAPTDKENTHRATLTRNVRSSFLRQPPLQPVKPRFLPLLHLAIYENLTEYDGVEADVALMSHLLNGLVNKLGIMAAQHGLPMVFRLQEDIPTFGSALRKIQMGSLVLSYLRTLSEKFGFEDTWLGREIGEEISRRESEMIWLDLAGASNNPGGSPHIDEAVAAQRLQSDPLKPFRHRESIVEAIASAWVTMVPSPNGSPSDSPVRKQLPVVADLDKAGRLLSQQPPSSSSPLEYLPVEVRSDITCNWSPDTVLAGCRAQPDSSKGISVNGSSRHNTFGAAADREPFAAAGGTHGTAPAVSATNGDGRPPGAFTPHQRSQVSLLSPVAGGGGRLASVATGNGSLGGKSRGPTTAMAAVIAATGGGGGGGSGSGGLRGDDFSTPISSRRSSLSSRHSVVRVHELKQALNSNLAAAMLRSGARPASRSRRSSGSHYSNTHDAGDGSSNGGGMSASVSASASASASTSVANGFGSAPSAGNSINSNRRARWALHPEQQQQQQQQQQQHPLTQAMAQVDATDFAVDGGNGGGGGGGNGSSGGGGGGRGGGDGGGGGGGGSGRQRTARSLHAPEGKKARENRTASTTRPVTAPGPRPGP